MVNFKQVNAGWELTETEMIVSILFNENPAIIKIFLNIKFFSEKSILFQTSNLLQVNISLL